MTFCVCEKNSVVTIRVVKNRVSIFRMGVGYGTVSAEKIVKKKKQENKRTKINSKVYALWHIHRFKCY